MDRRTLVILKAAAAGALGLVGGCASNSRPAQSAIAVSGGALFATSEDTAETFATSRRDAALNVSSSQALLATHEWPELPRATLADRRTVNLRSFSYGDSFVYFGTGRGRWR